MQQSCTYGSVRGASGNWRPYRDKTRKIFIPRGSAAVDRVVCPLLQHPASEDTQDTCE